jgi:hypothetical protein
MANRRYFGSIRVAWPETYARRADAVRVLAELERQSQVAGNWMAVDLAGSLDEPTQPSPNQATRPRLAQRVGSSPVRTMSRTGRSCCRRLPPRVAHR